MGWAGGRLHAQDAGLRPGRSNAAARDWLLGGGEIARPVGGLNSQAGRGRPGQSFRQVQLASSAVLKPGDDKLPRPIAGCAVVERDRFGSQVLVMSIPSGHQFVAVDPMLQRKKTQ